MFLPSYMARGMKLHGRTESDAFGLVQEGDIVIGLEQMFWDFQRGEQVVGLDWDIWMEFMVVAKSPTSEPLVKAIAAWLKLSRLVVDSPDASTNPSADGGS